MLDFSATFSDLEAISDYLEILVNLWHHEHDKHNIRDKTTILTLKTCHALTISQKNILNICDAKSS